MSTPLTPDPDRHGRDDLSASDFRAGARSGWPFWRGLVIGFLSAVAVTALVLSPSSPLFAG